MAWKPRFRKSGYPSAEAFRQHQVAPASIPSATARAVTAVPNPRRRKNGWVATLRITLNWPAVTLRAVVTGCPLTSPT